MSSLPLGFGMDSNLAQFMARQRIESQINLPRLFAAIDADPGVVGAGELTKRFTPSQLKHSTITQIKDVLGAAVGFTGSAYSGNVKTIAVGLYEEMDE
ncbi:hypothetical protein ALP94_04801 [Pseudomonas savastanoi pv. glycinea]|nr:hypothetical protein ALP94_04801 [Pseudomonas savastanoi pv. glycinea]